MSIKTLLPYLLLFLAAGCAGSENPNRPETLPVTGTVTLNGTPVEGATVTFNPEVKDGKAAFGKTDASGTFNLTTFDAGDGAMVGNYIVTATKFPTTQAPAGEEKYIPPGAPGYKEPIPPQNQLPNKYSAMHTSDLRAIVKKDTDNVYQFELTE